MSNPEPPPEQPPASPQDAPPDDAPSSSPPPAPGPSPAPPGYPPVPPQPGYGAAPQPPQPGYPAPGPHPGYGAPPGYGTPPAGYGPPPGQPSPGYGTAPGYGTPPPPGYGPAPTWPVGQAPSGQPGYPYQGAQPVRPARRTGLIIGIVAGAVALLLLLVCGVGVFLWYRSDNGGGGGDADLSSVLNYRETNPGALTQEHRPDGAQITYPMRPPAGGPHYNRWQNCNGDVYPAPIEDGNAVHSLEHGAVWITYREGLPADEVERLAERVRGQTYLLMSPYRFLGSKVTLQAWGYQLIVEDVDDERIDEFIRQYRETATIEPGATCGGGITSTK